MTGQQLKNSILQMAVQGKLVPQDPNDEPASVLLERIRAEKEQLIKEGKIKKEKNPSIIFRGADNLPYEKVGKNEPVCIADEVPFDIPESWEWVRLGTISTYAETKKKINAQDADPNLWGLDLEDIEKGGQLISQKTVGERKAVGDKTIFKCGDILYSKLRPYLLKILVAPNNGICTPEIVPFNLYGKINAYYIVEFLKSPYVDQVINSVTYGVKMPRVGTETMTSLLVPLPPISEQARIVARLKCVLSAVQSYNTAYDKGEKLTTKFPIQLKKSILQYAVQGKLVPQDPADEPASVLLERIRTEKEQLIKEGKIKRDKHESVIFRRDNSYYEQVDGIERCIDDELPFEIPESWEWCRLKSLTENITSGSRDWAKYYSTTGAAFLRMGNLSKNSFDLRLEHIQRVSIPSKAEGTRTSLQSGDLLFSITGDVGMLGLIPDGFEKAYINQHTAMIRFLPEMRNKYIPYLLLTDYAQKFYNANQHGIKNSFRLDSIGELLVSIPSEKELFRILQRISLVLSKIAVL
jgi:type I restriction enzyme S subunit